MRSFLRTLAFPIACAFTGAAAALFVVAVNTDPRPPACPDAPTIHIQHEMTPLAPPAPVPVVAPVAFAPALPVMVNVAPPPRRHAEAAELTIPEGAVRCTEDNHCVVDRGLYQLLRDNPSLFSHQARILPSLKDGQLRGLKFYAIRPGSLPRQLGLKNGDLLTAINGVPVTSSQGVATADALMQLLHDREHPVFSLAIERKGEPVRITVDVGWQQENAAQAQAR
ncbi:PDZ domain-containing protein [Nannocystis pusilla]|nr:hypothetical protein [Nannocystis pusilla]